MESRADVEGGNGSPLTIESAEREQANSGELSKESDAMEDLFYVNFSFHSGCLQILYNHSCKRSGVPFELYKAFCLCN